MMMLNNYRTDWPLRSQFFKQLLVIDSMKMLKLIFLRDILSIWYGTPFATGYESKCFVTCILQIITILPVCTLRPIWDRLSYIEYSIERKGLTVYNIINCKYDVFQYRNKYGKRNWLFVWWKYRKGHFMFNSTSSSVARMNTNSDFENADLVSFWFIWPTL